MRRLWVFGGLVAVLSSCGVPADAPEHPAAEQPAVTVGAAAQPANQLIARLYAGALQRMGTRVALNVDLGDRREALSALDGDSATVIPEFAGSLLAALDSSSAARDPEKVDEDLYRALPQGLSVSDYSDTTDWRASFALADAAARLPAGRSLTDLAPKCGELTLGIADNAPDPSPVLDRTYHCRVAGVRRYRAADLPAALASGRDIQLALLPPAVRPPADAVVPDPDYAVRADNPLPLYRTGALSQDQLKKLNYVAGELRTADLRDMLDRLRRGDKPDDLARAWLDSHSF